MALSTNLVSYWKLDSNSNDSVGSNNGTDTAISYATDGKISKSATFNVSTSKIDVGSNSSLDVTTGDMTWSFWTKLNSINAYDTWIRRGTIQVDGYYMSIDASNQIQITSNQSGTYQQRSSTATITTGVWTHVVMIKTGTNISFYKDGVSAGGGGSITNPTSSTYSMLFGQYDSSYVIDGQMDEIAIWSRALTADEVSQLFNSGRGNAYPLTDTPSLYGGVAYYKLDESSGDASDSISGLTLTNSNVTYSAQKINNGGVFNGSNAIFRRLNSLQYADNFSVSGWVKPTDATGAAVQNIVTNELSGTAGGPYQISIQTSGKLRFSVFATGTGTETYVETTGALSDNTYYFFTCVRDGTNIIIYLNGSSDNSTAWSTAQITNTACYFQVGATQNSGGTNFRLLTGAVDELAVWNRALSSTEVTALYNSGAGRQYPFNIDYILACAVGAFTLTGNAVSLLFKRIMAMAQGTFTYIGVAVTLRKGFGMVLASGTYAYTGVALGLRTARKLALATGSFAYTGVAVNFIKGYKMVIATGTYIYTGIAVILRPSNIWSSIAKSVTSWTESNKPNTAWTESNKPNTNWTENNKS